jgi:hypothetical protein
MERLAMVVLCAALGDVAGAQFVPTGGETQANVHTTNSQIFPVVSMSPTGRFVVVWQSYQQDGSGYGLFARLYQPDGSPSTLEFPINTTVAGEQGNASIAMDVEGDFIVVWDSSQTGGEIIGRRFASNGTALGGEFQINAHGTGSQQRPEIAMRDGGEFVVVWDSFGEDGAGYGVFGRRFDSAGSPLATAFQVNVYTAGYQRIPSIDIEDDGDFVVVWNGTGTAGVDGIWGRRFASTGTALGDEIRFSTLAQNIEGGPGVALAPDSSFVVVWQQNPPGILGRRASPGGSPLATEFMVNAFSASDFGPSLAMESDGDFLVAWAREVDGGASTDVIGQRFGASGARLGGEFRVNFYQPGSQVVPAVAAHPTKPEYVVAWQSSGQDGSSGGAFFQRYAGVSIDIDGNGVGDPLTDGLLFLRYLFGFRGAVLTGGAVAGNCTRCTAAEIEAFLDGIF